MKNQQIYSLKQLNFYQIIISKATTVTTSSSSINSLQILAESIYYTTTSYRQKILRLFIHN